MNLHYTAEERAFRDDVRAFLEQKLPADIAAKVKGFRRLTREDHQRWQRILSAQGWYATHWPETYGGVNWTPFKNTSGTRSPTATAHPASSPLASTWSLR